jgi:protein-disulfide isomerase
MRAMSVAARRLTLAAIATIVCLPAAATSAQQALPAQTPLVPPRGDASARVVILLFSDFECPYCARVEPVLAEVRKTFDKDVQVVFKHYPLPIHPRAPLAHEAAVEAARQGRFWEMHDAVFADQQRLDRADLIARAGQLGLDTAAFAAALDDRRHQATVLRDAAEARALGVTGTPTLFVNGQRLVGVPSAPQLIAYIRAVLSGKPVTDDNASIDPSVLNLARAPSRGPTDAPITIVEFSDFQCPFCGRATGTVDAVWKAYGGKVRWVFKHFPLDFHPDAPLAHRAALAAGEQGRFWEMHDLIFTNQQAMKREDLLRHAATLALDLPRFERDLDLARFEAAVQSDLAEGTRLGISGTPTFFINGQRLVGAQPLQAFRNIIDAELERLRASSFVRPAAGAPFPSDVLDLAMSRGPLDAPVTIRWYADFGSALHRKAIDALKPLLAAHADDVRIVFMHRPLEGRTDALFLHEAAIAAAEQGKFWEVHDLLVARPLQNKDTLPGIVAKLGVDPAWFEEALSSGRARGALVRHLAEAKNADVRGTPTFFVNSTRFDGVVSSETLESQIVKELALVKSQRQ